MKSFQHRVLILGGTGMLGHQLWLAARGRLDAFVAVRAAEAEPREIFDEPARVHTGVDAEDFSTVARVIDAVAPHVVINAIGLVKQRADAADPVKALRVNALFPHLLHRAVTERGARLILISTDCVFDGTRGGYRESDRTDAADLYGRSKALGEVVGPGALTLRTSMIGRELHHPSGLVEWFLSQRGREVQGYSAAVFSGLTTPVFSDLLLTLVEQHPDLTGLFHVGADAIDKARLLQLVNLAYDAQAVIVPSADVRIDRSLDSSAFRKATGWVPPSWESMVSGMAASAFPYYDWSERR